MPLNLNRKFIPCNPVRVTAAQLAALHTTPIVLAEGDSIPAGEFLQFMYCMLTYVVGVTPFTIGSAGNFAVKYGDANGASASGVIAAAGLIDQTDDTGALLQPVSGKVQVQDDLVLTLTGGNPSGGDGELWVRLVYRDPAMRVLEDLF